MSLQTLADAFYDELRDIFSAEKQIVRLLPKLVKKASHPDLKSAFEAHLKESEAHVQRVEAAFEETEKPARAKKCEAMAGLIKETEEMMGRDAAPEVMDAILIGCAQKVEHYEIATYGTLCTWAKAIGFKEALQLLKKNMAQEEAADIKLSKLSIEVNAEAAVGSQA